MAQKLTAKQQAFVNHYVICRNATEAAIKAGYSERSARFIGSENLTKPYIQESITERTKALTMSADEALMRLTAQARGTMKDFLRFDEYGDPVIDLSIIDTDDSKAAIIKSVNVTKTRKIRRGKASADDDDSTDIDEEVITVKFDLYDAQSALKEIIKLNRLDNDQATDNIKHDHHIKPKFDDLDDDDLDAFLNRFAERERGKTPPNLH